MPQGLIPHLFGPGFRFVEIDPCISKLSPHLPGNKATSSVWSGFRVNAEPSR